MRAACKKRGLIQLEFAEGINACKRKKGTGYMQEETAV